MKCRALGDTTTLSDPGVVAGLKERFSTEEPLSMILTDLPALTRALLRVLSVLVSLAWLPTPGARAADTAPSPSIRMNTVGFLPAHQKRASVAVPATTFRVLSTDTDAVAFSGTVTGPVRNPDTDEQLYTADFSALTKPGTYVLDVAGVGRSAPFRVAADVYDAPFAVATRAMYLWRCGQAVKTVYHGITYAHDACHLDDAYLDAVGGGHVKAASTGGWHDAGDYNKYVVNAGVTVGTLALAWEQFGPRVAEIDLGEPATAPTPSGKALPAFLGEIKWEMDWLLTTQAADGSVYHKVSTKQFGPSGPPELEKTERFFVPWGSPATADFVAVAATASRLFKPYDAVYAARCLGAARKSYAFLQAHPADHAPDQSGFGTGGYGTSDPDDRLWAAAALWETTGDPQCLSDFQTRAAAFPDKIDADWGWGDVKNLGMLTYVFSKRPGRDPALVTRVRNAILSTADGLVAARNAHGYGRPLGVKYYWGCNGGVANTTVLLQCANKLSPKADYVETALDALGVLFGRNPYGRSFVTGLGSDPPSHPHDRRSMGSPTAPAWPGYLVGGAWPRATDWVDVSARFQVNEIAINWNAPLIYALAGFVQAPASH